MKRVCFTVVLIFIIILSRSVVHAQREFKEVSFIPQWSPQAQFAGYYVAYEKGIYKKHGLNVRIIEGGAHKPASEVLERGDADVASMWLSTAIQKRSRKTRLVNIAQVVQRLP